MDFDDFDGMFLRALRNTTGTSEKTECTGHV
jgi:hypothetical protein